SLRCGTMHSQPRLLLALGCLTLGAGCPGPAPQSATPPTPVQPMDEASSDPLRHPDEVHLADVIQLTSGGENAEAYWSFDSKHLIFQTTRPPFGCDQIMRMPADGSGEPVLV